jgi:hypothetical protein
MIIKYIGISFITGAISHGFFSGTRQMMTAVAWIWLFIIGTLMEHDTDKNIRNICLAVGLAIGIGAVTGGLQHFPDSPERSLWILPVGFALSLLFYALVHGYTIGKKEYTYAGISLIATCMISVGIFAIIENTDIAPHGHTESSSLDVGSAEIWTISQPMIPTPIVPRESHTSDTDHHN